MGSSTRISATLNPTPFWIADDRQEAVLSGGSGRALELRSAAGSTVIEPGARGAPHRGQESDRNTQSGDRLVEVPAHPGMKELEVREEGGGWRRISYEAGRRWQILVMPTGHVDIYSTATYDKTPEEHALMIDAALGLCDRHPDFKYQIENLLPVVEYRELRAGRYDEVIDLLRQGRLGAGAQFAGIHHGEASAEELVQANLGLGRRLGVSPNCGYTVDVPAATSQYRQLLARLGIPRWIYSPNRFPPRGGFLGVDSLVTNLPSIGLASAPDGSAVTTWIPRVHYGSDIERFGLSAERLEPMRAAVDSALAELEAVGWPADVYPLEASAGDNLPPVALICERIAEFAAAYEWPRFAFCTATDVFDAVDAGKLATAEWGGEIGDTWAFLVANQAGLNPIVRDAVRDALAAEVAVATALSVDDADRDAGLDPSLAAAEQALLEAAKFEAHDWWYAGEHVMGIPDLGKAEFARSASRAGEQALDAAGSERTLRSGKSTPAAILNPTGIARTVPVAAQLPPSGISQESPPELVAGHFGAEPSSTAIDPPAPPRERLAISLIEFGPFEAAASPRDRAPQTSPSTAIGTATAVESSRFRVEFGDAGITSLYDKTLGREIVNGAIGALALATPQPEGMGIGFSGDKAGAQEAMRSGLRDRVVAEWRPAGAWTGPVFSAVLSESEIASSRATLAAVLYADLERLDITIALDWDGEPKLARIMAGFAFDLGDLIAAGYEVPFGSQTAGHEAPVGPATLSMTGRWVAFEGSAASVVVASRDCGVAAIGDPWRTMADEVCLESPSHASVWFAFADTGAPSPLVQPGRLLCRFSLTAAAGPIGPAAATRFATDFCEPVLATSRPSPAWRIGPPNILATILKPEWDGPGLVLRVVELDGIETELDLSTPLGHCELIEAAPDETPMEPASPRPVIRPYEIRTFLLR